MAMDAKKREYAITLLAIGDPFKAAFAVFPDSEDTSLAIEAATNWKHDPIVIEHQALALEDPESTGMLADKSQAAALVLARAQKCDDDEVFGKLMRLYADMQGHIVKPGAVAVGTLNVQNNKVIVMPAPVAKEQWSVMATAQQRELSCGNS